MAEEKKSLDFNSIRISIASPEEIKKWSYGEVTKPETINYRTQKPEREGLFDERIFGPTKNYECYCGKYKKIRYRGIICDKCGVEVTKSSVRRERMGHIELAVPVAHIWYVRGVPSRLGLLLDITHRDLERVIYFGSFIITEVNEEIRKNVLKKLESEFESYRNRLAHRGKEKIKIKLIAKLKKKDPRLENLLNAYKNAKSEISSLAPLKVISEERYHDIVLKYGDIIKVGIGAEAIYDILKKIDLKKMERELLAAAKEAKGQKSKKLSKRIKLVKDLIRAKIKPHYMMIRYLPVIPPDLRPMVQLDGGRFAASDLNDLYRRVINRNNRLKRLRLQGAPEVIQRNEKRMLQEAVDALMDNSARKDKAAATVGGRRKLRSLSDMLRGKQGRFRQNLLGKRVDYSGRSVIVVGPELKLHQCGLPKEMALELFKPFIIGRLIREGYAHNVKNATKLIDTQAEEVWEILEKLADEYLVLLNRAPTLHRLGVQAFKPVLIEGKAIQIHPLVNEAYNADYDGDQMAVYVPLSKNAQNEAKNIMISKKNILKPSSGEPVVGPQKDMVMGCYFLTTVNKGALGEGKIFASEEEAIIAHRNAKISLRALIRVKIDNKLIKTTVGRVLFNQILPKDFPFINLELDRRKLKEIIYKIYFKYGTDKTALVVNQIKDLGFWYACHAGITIAIDDIKVPSEKKEIIASGEKAVMEIEKQYRSGLITYEERYQKITEVWTGVKNRLEEKMLEGFKGENPINFMVFSGARGSRAQVTQIAGMKGLVVSPAGEIIEMPIKSNYKEGLSAYEYFISTHGARKGRSDTALRTAEAGYLTRRLIDVSQDVFITEKDCGTNNSIEILRSESEESEGGFTKKILGRNIASNLKLGKRRIKKGEMIDEEIAALIDKNKDIEAVRVYSPLTCECVFGICQKCYGRDLARGGLISLGESVGVIAAQAIGEPGTQLTMRTFHIGGIVGEDITQGLPRVEELFEARSPKMAAPLAEFDGIVQIKEYEDKKIITLSSLEKRKEEIEIPLGFKILIKDKTLVGPRTVIAEKGKSLIRPKREGRAKIRRRKVVIEEKKPRSVEYCLGPLAILKVRHGQEVKKGEILAEGSLDLNQLCSVWGELETQKYIIREMQAIYSSQGQAINDKHFEIIVRQMFSRVRVVDPGDSDFLEGQIVDRMKFGKINQELEEKKKKKAKGNKLLLGITKVALTTESFLSAASFQETTSVLIEAATTGRVDNLRGLKENVIIGRLIPVGTGFKKS